MAAPSNASTGWPTELRVNPARDILTVSFDSGEHFELGAEYLRVESPSADPIVVQLGQKWSAIGLDPATLGAIVASLAARGAQLVVSASEQSAAVALSSDAAFIVCHSVSSWKRVIAGARVVVTPDTGAAHLAGMLGIPVVDCFPDAGAQAQIARWHPWAARYTSLVASDLRGGAGVARIERAIDGF